MSGSTVRWRSARPSSASSTSRGRLYAAAANATCPERRGRPARCPRDRSSGWDLHQRPCRCRGGRASASAPSAGPGPAGAHCPKGEAASRRPSSSASGASFRSAGRHDHRGRRWLDDGSRGLRRRDLPARDPLDRRPRHSQARSTLRSAARRDQHPDGKNLAGAFHFPESVCINPERPDHAPREGAAPAWPRW